MSREQALANPLATDVPILGRAANTMTSREHRDFDYRRQPTIPDSTIEQALARRWPARPSVAQVLIKGQDIRDSSGTMKDTLFKQRGA